MRFSTRLTKNHPLGAGLLLALVMLTLVACNTDDDLPVAESTPVVVAEVEETTPPTVAATWTAVPEIVQQPTEAAATLPPPATSTPLPTSTAPPATNTPEPTPTDEPTATPEPTSTPLPRPTSPPATAAPPTAPPAEPAQLGVNLLPNPSFEEGHYNQNGVPELQLPNGWRLEWETGGTGFGNQAWDVYVRPETRVLSGAFLPPEEHPLFIFDGWHTVKIFKGAGAVSTRLITDVELQPGTYVLEVSLFADVFEGFADNRKIAPANLDAAQMSLFAGNSGTGWVRHPYLTPYKASHTFTITEPQKVPVGIGLRGVYAIANNGWFVDNLSLRRVE